MAEADVTFFKSLLSGEGRVLSEKEELDGYNQDWLGIARGKAQ